MSGCLPSIALLTAWKLLHPPTSWGEIAAIVLVTASLTAFVSWRVGLDQNERNRFATVLAHKWLKLGSAGS